jgi:serine/threonine-protein kinase
VDGRCDIYSLSAVIYEAVSGVKPFPGGTWIEIASRRILEPAPRIANVCPDLPLAFSEALAAGMHRDPDQRPATARELLSGLAAGLSDAVPPAAPKTNGGGTPARASGFTLRMLLGGLR